MIIVIINNNNDHKLTFGSPRTTWIPAPRERPLTGDWLPVEDSLMYLHKEKSPAPWGPCDPINPWEPLNPWGPIAPWDPLNPWGPSGPIGPREPFTPGGPTGPGSLLTFSTWKEMRKFLSFLYVRRFHTLHRSLERWKPIRQKKKKTTTTKIHIFKLPGSRPLALLRKRYADYVVLLWKLGPPFLKPR